ncbi:hypothetical protein C8R44DRAFT_780510 [Mycena epipterygia]|nr:hypothetical protein C8R44DRAFT_780510 [Mycena epipterygia]
MIPRFSNPHFIPRAIQSVARSDLFDEQANSGPDVEDLELQKKLDELIQSTLDPMPVKKKRKLNSTTEDVSETSVLFRLLSTSHTISLLPPPPPPSVIREPECEDSEAAAETRRRQSEAVAVDASWVMQESARLRPPFRVGRVERVQARPGSLLGSAPPVMLAQCLQSPRKTRPPVPRSQLQHYPYVAAPIPPPSPARGHIPSVEVEPVQEVPRKTRKRRRGRNGETERPQARFWWPEAGCGGKSLGYGMGYGFRT